MLNNYREMTGCKVITKGFSVRDIIKTLKDNGNVAMLADQDAGSSGIFINFLNRPASMAQGPVSFGLKTGAVILPSFIRREKTNKHIAEVGQPLELINTKNKENDMKKNLERLTDLLEGYIRKYPDQWLWSHKRWKSTPQRTVLILTDGKTGHLNQAMAVADMVRDALGSRLGHRGIKCKPIVKIQTVELKFRSGFRRLFLDIASLFAGRRCQGHLGCLKFCLKKETFDEIKQRYADIVISCGASTVGANIFLKYENNAKNVLVMKPGIGRSGKFNLVILPRHDEPGRLRPNMLVTDLALNRIMSRDKGSGTPNQSLRSGTGQARDQGIGVLVGGDAKNFKLTKESVEKVAGSVLRIAEELNRDIFISTSRRTSAEIDSLLKNKMSNHKSCKLLVIANENNPHGTMQKILDESEVVIVSTESVSMISEAVSAGKYVVVFRDLVPQGYGAGKARARDKDKYSRVIASLELQGYIKTAAPDEIYDTIKSILKERPKIKGLQDKEEIQKRLVSIV